MLRLIRVLIFTLPLAAAPTAFATTFASSGAGPSTTTSYSGSRIDGFAIVEDVAYDASAGRWQKELMNVGSGSGNNLASVNGGPFWRPPANAGTCLAREPLCSFRLPGGLFVRGRHTLEDFGPAQERDADVAPSVELIGFVRFKPHRALVGLAAVAVVDRAAQPLLFVRVVLEVAQHVDADELALGQLGIGIVLVERYGIVVSDDRALVDSSRLRDFELAVLLGKPPLAEHSICRLVGGDRPGAGEH